MYRFQRCAALVVIGVGALVTASVAMADEDAFASRLNQIRTADGIALAGNTPAVSPATASDALLAGGPSVSELSYRPRPNEATYQPRRNPDPYGTQYRSSSNSHHSSRGPSGYFEIHGGALEPDGAPEMQYLGGIKLAAMPDPRVHIGALVDWAHRGSTATEIVTTSTGPNGEDIRTQRELAQASTDLVPMLGFIQFTGAGRLPLIPYIGAGGGYQLLFLQADDFTTGQTFDATYGGWAWQAWAGVAIPFGRNIRLNGEVFRTGGTVGRNVDDVTGATALREELDVDGAGLRVGLAFAF